MSMQRKTIDLPKELVDAFEEIYPMRGAFTWFVTAALAEFVKIHTLQPGDEVTAAVRLTLGVDN